MLFLRIRLSGTLCECFYDFIVFVGVLGAVIESSLALGLGGNRYRYTGVFS